MGGGLSGKKADGKSAASDGLVERDSSRLAAGREMSENSGMSKAKERFDVSIRDAEDLLGHFDSQPRPLQPNAEVTRLLLAVSVVVIS